MTSSLFHSAHVGCFSHPSCCFLLPVFNILRWKCQLACDSLRIDCQRSVHLYQPWWLNLTSREDFVHVRGWWSRWLHIRPIITIASIFLHFAFFFKHETAFAIHIISNEFWVCEWKICGKDIGLEFIGWY